MKIVIFLAAVSATNIFVGVEGADLPPIIIKAHVEMMDSGGFEVLLPINLQIQNFTFHGHVNRSIEAGELGTIVAHVHRQTDGEWVYRSSATLHPGETIAFWLEVGLNGQRRQSMPDYFIAPGGRSAGLPVIPIPARVHMLSYGGFKVTLPENLQLDNIEFDATIYRGKRDVNGRRILRSIHSKQHGQWTLTDRYTELHPGDRMDYSLRLDFKFRRCTTMRQSFTAPGSPSTGSSSGSSAGSSSDSSPPKTKQKL